MHIPETDLDELRHSIASARHFGASMPGGLSDAHLHQIARDLRRIERAWTLTFMTHDPHPLPLAGPMYLIQHMMQEHANTLRPELAYSLPPERLGHWLARYMHYVEREVVGRLVNIEIRSDTDCLSREVLHEIRNTTA